MLNSESARLCSSTRLAVSTVLSEQSNAGLAANSVARRLVPARQCWDGVGNFHAASEFAGRASPTGRHLQLVSCSCKLLHAPLATSALNTIQVRDRDRLRLEHFQNSFAVFSRMATKETMVIPGASSCPEAMKMV